MEQQLLIEIKKGNRLAFRKLYDLYFDYAIRVATAVTANQATAADVVQETFIRVYKHIQEYDETKPFKSWFYRILINECNRYQKKYAKVIPIEVNEQLNLPPEIDQHHFEEYEELYRGIQRLTDLYRIPLVLKYLHDFTENEISLALDLNVNTVKSRLFKGRQKLKDILAKRGGDSYDQGKF